MTSTHRLFGAKFSTIFAIWQWTVNVSEGLISLIVNITHQFKGLILVGKK
jgi:hypothetical protein